MAGEPAGGGALVSGAGLVPPVPFFAGVAGRVTGGAPGTEGEFLPASALGGVAVLGGTVAGAVPADPFFAGAAGRVAGGLSSPEGEFLPVSEWGGATVLVGAAALGDTGFFPVAGALPADPFFAGTAGRAAGGVPGAGGEFLPASALDGAVVFAGAAAPGAVAAGFFPGTGAAAPEFPSLVKSAGLVPGGLSPYVCFCSWPNA